MNAARVLLLVVLAARAAYAADQSLARVEIDAKQPVLVGQQVKVNVTVLVPNFFLSSPQFPALDVPGATVQLLDGAENTSETIGGTTYAGIRKTYAVTPERAGELGVRLDECTCYTDDAGDLALLELVGEPIAVNPDPRLRRQAVRRGWPVLDFAAPGERGAGPPFADATKER